MDLSEDDKEMLLDIIATDPDFVDQYLGDNNPTFTVSQCAKALNVCSNTVLYRIKVGGLKGERADQGHWLVRAKELQNHIRLGGNQKGFASTDKTKTKENTMKNGSFRYDKSSMQNVLDFIYSWSKANPVGFSTKTLLDDFNKVCATKTTESQMSNILSNLTRKEILVRKGRGLYAAAPGLINNSEPAPVAPPVAPPVAVAPVAIPTIERNETPYDDADNPHWEEMKAEERHLVDKFLARYAKPYEDYVFSIAEVSEEYPRADRKKLAKAIQNMYSNDKLGKGDNMGEYVKRATKKIELVKTTPMIQTDLPETRPRSILSKSLENILGLDISDDLKAKIIKEMMT